MAMQHQVRDGVVAARRARGSYTPNWHPVLAAVEIEPGHWQMCDEDGQPYGVIRIIRLANEVGYRAVTWAPDSAGRELIGYFRTLRASAEAVHRRFLRTHGQSGPINGRPPGA